MKTLLTIVLTLPLIPLCLLHAEDREPLDFNRDIRPILSSKCFACHGPDEQERDADLRLDTAEGAFADLGGYAAIVPGKPEESEAIYRITTDDEGDIMPPPKHKNPLTEQEITTLERWVAQGAPYARHWAFEPIAKQDAPQVDAGSNNPIDRFIANSLTKDGLAFSPKAAPETLVRRLYLDLTGLPPTPAQVDTFLADPDGQYDANIDQLMQSDGFAERLAQEWLDVARFADTNGYSIDDHRDVWVWRDWVIDAFAKNLPYDEFIRLQLAGDLLESPSEHQLVATGFLRNAMNTHEGGTIDEEYRVARIADQLDTVSTAFLGLTVKCAQCHDHKYDPISQADYYRMFAFFNTSSEPGKGAGGGGNTPPKIDVSPILQDDAEFREAIQKRITELRAIIENPTPYLDNPAEALSNDSKSKTQFRFPDSKELPGLKLSWIWPPQMGDWETAYFRKSFTLDTIPQRAQIFVSCDNEAKVWVNGQLVGEAPDWRNPAVLDIHPNLHEGENLIAIEGKNWEGNEGAAALLALASFSDGTYIGTNGTWQASTEKTKQWNRSADTPDSFVAPTIIAKHPEGVWGDTFTRFPDGKAPLHPDLKKLYDSIKGEIRLLETSLKKGKTGAMVMDSGAADRTTPILVRGAYDQHGEIVQAGIPAAISSDFPSPTDVAATRLDLANWLTDPSNPLTARVTVNRYWQMLFGTGLVKTSEDFGSQGEWPSHPELLDWLASDFIASGWDVRALLKTMLSSRVYQQNSDVDPALLEADPYNRLLARAPRFRLPAESIRDGALAIGGLLHHDLGGPSVYPPQPKGLWKEISHFGHSTPFSAQHFFGDKGEPAYRRSIYSFWKRTSPPPVMQAFDAPNRETCSVRRSLTNTPLQALVLMNEPQFLAAARGLAGRMATAADEVTDQLTFGFRLATARLPHQEELAVLQSAYQDQLEYFTQSPDRAQAYLGLESATPASAALASVASLILNLDETITRE